MTYILLFWEFFKTGLFSVGGGLATVPYLYEMAAKYPKWFNATDVSNMLAVSESTPGPIGVNMATYVGFKVTGNVFGAITTTVGLVTPSVIIMMLIALSLSKFSENRFVKAGFYGIRPAVMAFIAITALNLMIPLFFAAGVNIKALILFAVLMVFTNVKPLNKIHPIVTVGIAAAAGIIFSF
ncbi:MAG: chromate transporter [Oscillospiraceae bacterium]|nr:chromate transporter [Candidatus Equicaccousia limihippi]